MKRPLDWSYQWVFYLVAGFYFVAVSLRSILIYQDRPEFSRISVLLAIWLALAASEPAVSRRWGSYFSFYLACQTGLVFMLLSMPGFPDFYAALLAYPSMQIMLRLNPKVGAAWIGTCALFMVLVLFKTYKNQAIALSLIYTAGNVFYGTYALANRRAHLRRFQNLELARQLQGSNLQLKAFSEQLEGLAIARERNRLARELHDSVTQTVFSMTLVTKSAALLLDREPTNVRAQLDRLSQLAQNALSEMQLLISELNPLKVADGGLISALRRHLQNSRISEDVSIALRVEGDGYLEQAEEQGLFRILQEAVNNIAKHAQASQACITLHLAEPFWLEVEDQGRGFDLDKAMTGRGVGLKSMRERAAEIGWDLQVVTSLGAGTRIRIERLVSERRQG